MKSPHGNIKYFCFPVFFFPVLFLMIFLALPSMASVPGKGLFKSKCLDCHYNGGEAEAVGPNRYASIQWEKFFKKNKHKKKKDISASVSLREIEIIQGYLIDHAADSDRPEAAGLR